MSIGSKERRDRKRKQEAKRARSRAARAQQHVQNVTTAKAEDNLALVQRLHAVVTDLERHGLRINRSGRIHRYMRDLEQFEARTTPLEDPAEIERFAAARMDGALLADTFEVLRRPPEVPNWRSPHFELALKGEVVAGGEDDRPRAKLLELYVAAVAKNAGYGVELEEPDVVLTVGGAKYGCAAKRPRSIRRLQDRIEEGIGQIAGQDLDGFLIVDLTLALGLHEGLYQIENFEEYERVSWTLFQRVAELSASGEVDRWIRNHSAGHRVFGVGVVAFATVYVRSTRKLMGVRRWIGDGIRTADNDAKVAFFHEFITRLR